MKKAVLLGDSIRLSYCARVGELLAGECEVLWPEENCAYTMYTLRRTREWFEGSGGWGTVDLIHYNNGIWDHHRVADDGEPLSTPEQYLYLNRRLHRQLAEYAPKLIWATTIPAGEAYQYTPHWVLGLKRDDWNREIREYNALLSGYLSSQGVEINDLYALVAPHPEYITTDGIHLTAEGVEAAAQQVASHIRAASSRTDGNSEVLR